MATLKELVAKKSRVDGECRIWLGHLTKEHCRPYAYPTIDGKRKGVDIHRYLAIKKFSLAPREYAKVITTCGNPRCINMKHIQIVKIERGKRSTSNSGVKKANVELNMEVFKLLVTQSTNSIAEQLKIDRGLVYRILTNNAMLPYFQLCIQWHTGLSMAELRELNLTTQSLKLQRLSNKAIRYIQSEQDYRIVDEDAYLDVLKQCDVVGDHLVWLGELKDGIPTYKTFGGHRKNAAQQMYFAQYGAKSERIACMCGTKHCINPLHLE